MKKFFAILTTVLMLCTVFVGCSSEPAEPIIGEWSLDQAVFYYEDELISLDSSKEECNGILTVNKDGTFELDFDLIYDDLFLEGEWSESSQILEDYEKVYTIKFTFASDDFDGTIAWDRDHNVMAAMFGGIIMSFSPR